MNNIFSVEKMQLVQSDKNKNLKAFVTINIANAFIVNSIKIMEGKSGLFISMPQDKYTDETTGKSKWIDTVKPMSGFKKDLNDTILEAFKIKMETKQSKMPCNSLPSSEQ